MRQSSVCWFDAVCLCVCVWLLPIWYFWHMCLGMEFPDHIVMQILWIRNKCCLPLVHCTKMAKISKAEIVISCHWLRNVFKYLSFILLLSEKLLSPWIWWTEQPRQQLLSRQQLSHWVFVYVSVLSLLFFSLCFQLIVLCCHTLYLCVWGQVCEPWKAWERAWRAFRFDAGADHSGIAQLSTVGGAGGSGGPAERIKHESYRMFVLYI